MILFSLFPKFHVGKLKLFLSVVLFLGIALASCVLIKTWSTKSEKKVKITHIKQNWNMTFQYVVVHFDLKGVPPRISYLQSTLQTLKDHGTTALLVEYEDMFPYEGTLVNLTARNSYKRNECRLDEFELLEDLSPLNLLSNSWMFISELWFLPPNERSCILTTSAPPNIAPNLMQFLVYAKQVGLEVIPLVQTFGHLEFALKQKEFQHLREDPQFPDTICPSKNESRELLKEMLRQVIQFHKNVAPFKHFHVGCDEVHQIKECELCSEKDSSKSSIVVEHLRFISDVIGDLSPKTKILVWDDIFKHIKKDEFMNLRFPNMESVSWESRDTSLEYLHPSLRRYEDMVENQWVAAAYKGTDGPTRTIPVLKDRFANYLNWLNFVMIHDCIRKVYVFKGIIFTGKSRYSHLEPPCELFPVATPSLLLGLILVKKYHNGIVFYNDGMSENMTEDVAQSLEEYIDYFITDDLNAGLRCQNTITDGDFLSFQAMTCIFEGSDLHVILSRYSETREVYTFTFFGGHDSILSSGINMDDTKLGYINMVNVKGMLDISTHFEQELIMIESQVVDAMSPYYDKCVVEEYVGSKLSKMKKKLNDLMQFLSDYYVVRHWPRRYSDLLWAASQDAEKKEKQTVSKQHADDW